MPTKPLNSPSTRSVPIEFSGKWVAWNSDHSRIVAHSDDVHELWRIALDHQIADPVFEKIPRADARFVGMR